MAFAAPAVLPRLGGQPIEEEVGSRSWLSKLAGRRLKGPFRGPALPTLSDWLTDRAVPNRNAQQDKGQLQIFEGAVVMPNPPSAPAVRPMSSSKRPGSSSKRPGSSQRPGSSHRPGSSSKRLGSNSSNRRPGSTNRRPGSRGFRERPITGTLLGTGKTGAGAKRRHQQQQRVHPTIPRGFVPAMCRVGETEPLADGMHNPSSDEEWLTAPSSSAAGGFGKQIQSDVFEECSSGIVIGGGSVFSNSAARSLPKAALASGTEMVEGSVIPTAKPEELRPASKLRPLKIKDEEGRRMIKEGLVREKTYAGRDNFGTTGDTFRPSTTCYSSSGFSSSTALSAIGSDEDGTLILPRAKALRQLTSGSVVTKHVGEAGADYVLSKCTRRAPLANLARIVAAESAQRGSTSPAKSKSGARGVEAAGPKVQNPLKDTDRKWHLRQAPLSAAVAQTPRRHKRVLARSSDAGLAAFPNVTTAATLAPINRGPLQEKEYLCFEGWGVDDAYVRGLLQVTSLRKTRFINLTDNRLTESSVQLFTEMAEKQMLPALESLRIGKNRLDHAGGMGLVRFFAEIQCPLQELDISDSGISDQACADICEKLVTKGKHLVGLCMARNNLGQPTSAGIKAAGAVGNLCASSRKLQALDMHWNNFQGAAAVALLQGFHDNATQIEGQLWRVNLAWNRLGARCKDSATLVNGTVKLKECSCEACDACHKVAQTLANIFYDCNVLFHLDLSYNQLRAAECAVIAEGLKNNHTLYGLHVAGNEAQIDDVGFLVPMPSLLDNDDRQEVVRHADVVCTVNSSVRHTPQLLKINRVGQLQVTKGGAAGVDRVPGDSIDRSTKTREMVVAATRQNPSLQLVSGPEAFSEQDLLAEKEWIGVHSRLHSCGADFAEGRNFEDVRINERCCWICENWVEETISYIPGWSGCEATLDEVQSVYAYFSIDGYAQPSRLSLTTEKYYERLFRSGGDDIGADHVSKLDDGKTRKPFVDDKGRYAVYRASRCLPPSSDPVRIIFQVSGRLITAGHMRRADTPKITIKLHSDGRESSQSGALPALAVQTGEVEVIEEANVLHVGVRAWDRFQRGMLSALCVMEDPRHRGDLKVMPRRLQHDKVMKVQEAWRLETSIFKDFNRDSDTMFKNCFDHDWACTKLERSGTRLGKDQDGCREVCDYLRNNYEGICAAYHGRSLRGFQLARTSAGLTLLQFNELLSMRSEAIEPEAYMPPAAEVDSSAEGSKPPPTPTSPLSRQASAASSSTPSRAQSAKTNDKPRKTIKKDKKEEAHNLDDMKGSGIYGPLFRTADGDRTFIAANVVDKDNRMVKEMTVLPNQGLARFQFLEALVRCAFERFLQTGTDTPLEAVKNVMKALEIGAQQVYLRQTLLTALFCEECDLVERQQIKVLEAAFNKYCKRCPFPGRGGGKKKQMSYGAWLEFMADCEPESFGLNHLDFGSAFALGRESRTDEYTSYRSMELSWSEFLVCVAACVRLCGRFKPENFSDLLIEFTEEYVSKAAQKGASGCSRYSQDPEIQKLVNLISKVFTEADADGSGSLTQAELTKVVRQKTYAASFREVGFSTEDFKVLFNRIDADDSGDVTLDELAQGMVFMKKAMAGIERGLAYMRKAFEEADDDKSGFLTAQEFQHLLDNQTVRDKLAGMGISTDEVDDIWAAVDANHTVVGDKEGVTCEEMTSGLLSMRESKNNVTRGINFMHQVFKSADVDKSGCLVPQEVEEAFCTERVSKKLESLALTIPDWLDLFTIVDLDGDGELSWEELHKGVSTLWEQDSREG